MTRGRRVGAVVAGLEALEQRELGVVVAPEGAALAGVGLVEQHPHVLPGPVTGVELGVGVGGVPGRRQHDALRVEAQERVERRLGEPVGLTLVELGEVEADDGGALVAERVERGEIVGAGDVELLADAVGAVALPVVEGRGEADGLGRGLGVDERRGRRAGLHRGSRGRLRSWGPVGSGGRHVVGAEVVGSVAGSVVARRRAGPPGLSVAPRAERPAGLPCPG